jgi:hypothetical protein
VLLASAFVGQAHRLPLDNTKATDAVALQSEEPSPLTATIQPLRDNSFSLLVTRYMFVSDEPAVVAHSSLSQKTQRFLLMPRF